MAIIAWIVWGFLTYLYYVGPESELEKNARTAAVVVAMYAAHLVYLANPQHQRPRQ